jgi:UDP-N-acetylglucosamine acyltransferase
VEQDVVLGSECVLEPYVFVKRWTTMGERNTISAGTVLGTDPLDKNFKGERSYLRIGNENQIREHYTISRGTQPESTTLIGDGNYIMTSGHIAHNSTIGNNVVIASCALVAGHVTVEDRAFISGGVVIHQFSRIGALAMIGGNTRVNLDVPPYFLYSGFDVEPIGVNLVGLKRAGFAARDVSQIKRAYRLLYRSGLKLAHALDRIAAECDSEHAKHLVDFVRKSERGICRPSAGSRGKC